MNASIDARVRVLLAAGQPAEAWALLHAAGSRGDADALFQAAFWLLTGEHVERDVPQARQVLAQAARRGHADAALFEISLTANGSGGVADWPRALALSRRAAHTIRVAAEHLALLEKMALTDAGAPLALPDPEELAPDGAVVRFPALLTSAECAHVAQAGAAALEPAQVIDPISGRHIAHPHRTSDGAVLGPTRETLPVRAINARIAAISGTAIDQGEALTVLRYAPGQEYRPHHDALPGTRNQRVLTVLVYLNEGFGGGETVFPDYGLSVTPRGGDALLFRNTTPDGRPDPRARHAGAPVTRGSKWLATRWIRARPFSLWTGPDA